MREHLIAAQRNTSMSLGHLDLITALARERQDALVRESAQRRLVREARFAQTPTEAPGWAARVRRTLAFRRRPVHGQSGTADSSVGSGGPNGSNTAPSKVAQHVRAASDAIERRVTGSGTP